MVIFNYCLQTCIYYIVLAPDWKRRETCLWLVKGAPQAFIPLYSDLVSTPGDSCNPDPTIICCSQLTLPVPYHKEKVDMHKSFLFYDKSTYAWGLNMLVPSNLTQISNVLQSSFVGAVTNFSQPHTFDSSNLFPLSQACDVQPSRTAPITCWCLFFHRTVCVFSFVWGYQIWLVKFKRCHPQVWVWC